MFINLVLVVFMHRVLFIFQVQVTQQLLAQLVFLQLLIPSTLQPLNQLKFQQFPKPFSWLTPPKQAFWQPPLELVSRLPTLQQVILQLPLEPSTQQLLPTLTFQLPPLQPISQQLLLTLVSQLHPLRLIFLKPLPQQAFQQQFTIPYLLPLFFLFPFVITLASQSVPVSLVPSSHSPSAKSILSPSTPSTV